MRNFPYWMFMLLGCASMSLAQATTMPDPAVQTKVLVVPFVQIGATDHEWVGQAINENLVTQVAGNSAVRAINLNVPLNGQAEAVSAAQHVGAPLVIFGTYQFADTQLRVTGQVYDTVNNRTVAALTSTGALTDLFKIEDAISNQVSAALPQVATNQNQMPVSTYGPAQSPTDPTVATADVQPTQTYVYGQAQQPTYVYAAQPSYAYSYPYPYSYGYYGGYYGYPYYGGIVVIGGGRGFRGGGWGGRGGWGGGGRGGFVGGGMRGGGGFGGGGHR
jgi:TolB-like protein